MTTARGQSWGKKRPEFTIVDRLRKAREEAGLEQRELADRIAVSRGTIGNYESGQTPPKVIVLRAWAAVCDVDEEWLIGDYQPPKRRINPVITGWSERRIARVDRRRGGPEIIPGWDRRAA